MADVVDKATRSRMMSSIRSKNTLPELQVRSLLHRAGFRFRLHRSDLPGKPDLVLPKHSAVIFVHGCFWHGHRCSIFKWPKSNVEFWREKITGNKKRDKRHAALLMDMGWRVLTIWECALRGREPKEIKLAVRHITKWLNSGAMELTIPTGAAR